jgi:hypothetical protein
MVIKVRQLAEKKGKWIVVEEYGAYLKPLSGIRGTTKADANRIAKRQRRLRELDKLPKYKLEKIKKGNSKDKSLAKELLLSRKLTGRRRRY